MNKDTIKELKQICPAWGWFIGLGDNMYDSVRDMDFEYGKKHYNFYNTQCCVVGEFWKGDDNYLNTCSQCDDFCVDILIRTPAICEETCESNEGVYYCFSEDEIKNFIKHVKECHKDMIKQ